ncbi:MAG: tetratricopeptide repeat protein [Nitrospirae bacterium]|nr:tetratricopeptide repeat protein [Nitrospirota bacterium]
MRVASPTRWLSVGWALAIMVGGCASVHDQAAPAFGHGPLLKGRSPIPTAQGQPTSEPGRSAPDAPLDAAEYERLGDQYARQGSVTLAFAQYERALRVAPTAASVRHKRGMLLLTNGFPQDAKQEFLALIREHADYAAAFEGLGQALLQLDDSGPAEEMFRSAIQIDPRLWRAHVFLGILYDSRRRHQEAIDAYRTALGLKPAHPDILNNLGMSYYLAGDFEQAIDSFQQALRAGADGARISNNLAMALARVHRYRDAYEAFSSGTDAAKAANNMGVVFAERGYYREARRCFEHAFAISPAYYEAARTNLHRLMAERTADRGGRTAPPPPDHWGICR